MKNVFNCQCRFCRWWFQSEDVLDGVCLECWLKGKVKFAMAHQLRRLNLHLKAAGHA
jgi:hypothetical protein